MKLRDALLIVSEASASAREHHGTGRQTVEALRFLRDCGVDRVALVAFWQALHMKNEDERFNYSAAALLRIRMLLIKAVQANVAPKSRPRR